MKKDNHLVLCAAASGKLSPLPLNQNNKNVHYLKNELPYVDLKSKFKNKAENELLFYINEKT